MKMKYRAVSGESFISVTVVRQESGGSKPRRESGRTRREGEDGGRR